MASKTLKSGRHCKPTIRSVTANNINNMHWSILVKSADLYKNSYSNNNCNSSDKREVTGSSPVVTPKYIMGGVAQLVEL